MNQSKPIELLATAIVGSRRLSLIAIVFAVIAHLAGSTWIFWVVVAVALSEMTAARSMHHAGVRMTAKYMATVELWKKADDALNAATEIIRAYEADGAVKITTLSEN